MNQKNRHMFCPRLLASTFKYCLAIKIFLLANVLTAQVITYNENITFTLDTTDVWCSGLVEVNGRNFLACTVLFPGGYRICIAEIDSTGNKVWTKIIGDSANTYSVDNGLNKTRDENLIMTGSYRNLLDTVAFNPRIFLAKLTLEGDLIWMKLINDTIFTDINTRGIRVIETSDKGFAVIGQIGVMGILYKTDSLGNLLWYKTFRSGQTTWFEFISSIQQLPDSGFMIGSYGYNYNIYQSGDPLIYRITKTGGTVWKKFIGGPHPEEQPIPFLSDDSTIVVLSPYTTKASSFGDPQEIKLRILQLKLASGTILSDAMYGNSNKCYRIKEVQQLEDGSFVACGSDVYGRFSWLFGFSGDGDSLFLRYYKVPGINRYDTLRSIQECILCSDGGILATGQYFFWNSSHYGWIVKTDRYGCFEMGCDTNAIYILDQPDSSTKCRDQTDEMIIATYIGNKSFQWQVLDGSSWMNISDTAIYKGIDSDSLLIDLSGLNQYDYWYRCKVYNNYYEVFSDSAELIIKDTVSFLNQPQDQFVRKHDTVVFSVITGGQEPVTYQWYNDGEPVQNSSDDSLIIYPVSNDDTGFYFCRVVNPCGQEDSRSAKLSINYTFINQLIRDPVIQYYPNPACEYLTIEILTAQKSNILLKIMDISGRILSLKNLSGRNNYKENIDLSYFEPRLYFLEIRIGDETYLKKIIKSAHP
jgi:hypothetical protein